MRLFTLAPARSALAWRAAAAAALAVGYIDLVRGGLTLAPVVLVLAYLVLIPIVVLTW